jgi:hypothetical protein
VVYYGRLSTTWHWSGQTTDGDIFGGDPFPLLVNLIKEGQEKGEIHQGDAVEMAHEFTDLYNGAMQRRLVQGKADFTPIHSDTVLRIFEK